MTQTAFYGDDAGGLICFFSYDIKLNGDPPKISQESIIRNMQLHSL